MEKKEFLNEEKYEKTEKSITLVATLILVIGLCIGGFLIYRGIAKPGKEKVEKLKTELQAKKSELEAKGVKYSSFAEYTDGEAYDLKIITDVLNPKFSRCMSDEYKNNSITAEYCAAENSVNGIGSDASLIGGIFVCIFSLFISFPIFTFAKGRSILAFHAQQTIPIAQETMEKMAPTVGKAGATIGKEMAPALGEIARSVSKGIKEGMSTQDEDEKDK